MTESIIEMIKEKIEAKRESMVRYWGVRKFERANQLSREIEALKDVLTGIDGIIRHVKNETNSHNATL